jgi:DNA-binding NarL/FixJ family response regulator
LRAAGEAITEIQASDLGLLTPQELQISLAVANGLTNREVAASLFLSPKTVEFHLGNVYSKLALRSRTDLVRLIAAQA